MSKGLLGCFATSGRRRAGGQSVEAPLPDSTPGQHANLHNCRCRQHVNRMLTPVCVPACTLQPPYLHCVLQRQSAALQQPVLAPSKHLNDLHTEDEVTLVLSGLSLLLCAGAGHQHACAAHANPPRHQVVQASALTSSTTWRSSSANLVTRSTSPSQRAHSPKTAKISCVQRL